MTKQNCQKVDHEPWTGIAWRKELVLSLPVVWTLILTWACEGWGILYPQNVTLGLQD